MFRPTLALLLAVLCKFSVSAVAQSASDNVAAPVTDRYPPIPSIPAIGVRNGRYLDVPAASRGPAIDPAKGYRIQDLGDGLYMVTDNIYQSMFLVYDQGVAVIDA